MLKQNVDRKSVIDREIRAIKSQSRYNFTVLAPNGDNRIFRIGSPDDKSSIFTFNDNHNDVEDIDLTKEVIPSREEVLEVRNFKAIFTLRICPRYFEPRRSSSKFEISKVSKECLRPS